MVIGNSKNLCVFIFVILLKLQKSRKFDARKNVLYSKHCNSVRGNANLPAKTL